MPGSRRHCSTASTADPSRARISETLFNRIFYRSGFRRRCLTALLSNCVYEPLTTQKDTYQAQCHQARPYKHYIHSLARILSFSDILENQFCYPASAGIFEGHQIWKIPFKRACSVGFLKAYIVWAAYYFFGRSLKTKSVIQRRLEFLKAVRFGRYVLNELVRWDS